MRRILLAMATMSFAVLVLGGVAYALTVQCDGVGDQEPAVGFCLGTIDSDKITGTSNAEVIETDGGNDTVRALAGNDEIIAWTGRERLFGDEGNDIVDAHQGNDVVHGGPDNDGGIADFAGNNLEGAEDSDVVYGEEGDDVIDAAINDTTGSRDRSIGGAGNDQINAADGNKDVINCGAGAGDLVVMDELDTQRNCESVQVPGL